MAKRMTLDAVVLRTVDIGEADRLCVLFTREAGRMAAKAKAVRKPGSRMGGTLLPFRHVSVDISAAENRNTVTGVLDKGDGASQAESFNVFLCLQQGVEFLLALTEDDEPLPKVFDLLLQFLRLADKQALLPFQLRLLHLLGHLPANTDDSRYASLDAESQAFVQACIRIVDLSALAELNPSSDELVRFLRIVGDAQLHLPMKSTNL